MKKEFIVDIVKNVLKNRSDDVNYYGLELQGNWR